MDPLYLLAVAIMEDRLRDAEKHRRVAMARASRPRRRSWKWKKAGEAV